MKAKFFILIVVVFGGGKECLAQTLNTVDSLEKSYHSCLDKGVNMINCSKIHYSQMDSLLNVVYQKLKKKLPASQFGNLRTSQLSWLSKRDRYFANIPLEPEEIALGGKDKEMVIIDKKAEFVRKRVVMLLKRV